MTSLTISLFVIIFVSIGYCAGAANPVCGPNESLDSCHRKCAADYCPTSELEAMAPCPEPTTCPMPACTCNFNYRRAANNTCIPTRECPPFKCSGPNEMYDPCPSYCPSDDCSNANPTGECPSPFLILIVVNCSPSCRCIPHYWRNNGTCVPYLECPGIKKQLEENGNNGPEFSSPFLE